MKLTVALLRILATLLVLSCLIGLLVTVYAMIVTFESIDARGAIDQAVVGKMISLDLLVTSCSFLFFPIGVVLHWIIAKKTGVFSVSSRQAIFWSSLFMCLAFPVGTIVGGITMWKLITSDVFKVKEQPDSR